MGLSVACLQSFVNIRWGIRRELCRYFACRERSYPTMAKCPSNDLHVLVASLPSGSELLQCLVNVDRVPVSKILSQGFT